MGSKRVRYSYDSCLALVMLFDYLLPDIGSIYPLLDHHGLTRHEIHLRCMKALKGKLLHQLETAQMDNARLDIIFSSVLAVALISRCCC